VAFVWYNYVVAMCAENLAQTANQSIHFWFANKGIKMVWFFGVLYMRQ
jgi:hypothetical protein